VLGSQDRQSCRGRLLRNYLASENRRGGKEEPVRHSLWKLVMVSKVVIYAFELVNRALDVRVELTETESLLELVGADVATELEELVEVGNETDQLPLTTRKVGL
jgi:hypothetical protein